MSSSGTEYRGFVFSLTFIIVFTALVASIPTGYQGLGDTPENITAIDPNIISGFADSINFTPNEFSPIPPFEKYDYDLNSDSYRAYWSTVDFDFMLDRKILILDLFWFGAVDECEFKLDGASRGTDLAFSEIQADAEDGVVTYSIEAASASVGSFIFHWNDTLYPSFKFAWGNDSVDVVHGIGFAESATADVGQLIIGLLFLQLPDVPVLLNLILASPLWASIIYLLWFIIKEMIPFV